MKETNKLTSRGLSAAFLIGFAAMTPGALFAAGTVAGTDVTNTVTVGYSIDGVAQPDVSDDVTFEVDVLVNPVVANVSGVSVAPDEEDVVLEFTVTNSGNDVQDFVLDVEQGGGDSTDLENLALYIDVNGDGAVDGGDLAVSLNDLASREAQPIQDLAIDGTVNVIVVGNIPAEEANSNTIDINLIAVAYDAGANDTTLGAIEVETATPAIDAVDTVFGDAAGTATGDVDEDGVHSATGTYTVGSVTITVTKTAAVIDNGLDSDAGDAFFIPGATVEYTITVTYGGSTSASADSLVVVDPIPANTTYVAESITLGAVAQTDEDNTAVDFSDYDGAEVTVALQGTRNGDSDPDIITFRVTID